ncbi:transposase family protein [Pseudoalteromonas luteoviolacea]|nr:transposase family protein [Pseudoalteromonas luteoviolacea]MBQ4908463.1 transposase family protein [Pseudoalteromonas luteoviolacea]
MSYYQPFVPFKNGIPHHDTIDRVISRIDITQFKDSFSF